MTDDEKAFADWTAAGNGVPLQYKGREHVWDRKVDARMKKGGAIHMDDGGAAFGTFPQMKPKRSKQDAEAAKNVPVDLARGFASGVLGAPGDIESLIRMLPYLDEKTVLPTSEDIEKRLPFRSESPVSRAAAGLGSLAGGFYTGPGAPFRVVGALPGAIKHGAEEFAKASAAGASHVIKPKGGNWLTGSVEKSLEPLKRRMTRAAEQNFDPTQGMTFGEIRAQDALDNWVDSNLTNYVKKQMGTPEDPVRKLAEEGITPVNPEQLNFRQEMHGRFMNEGQTAVAQSPAAKSWEGASDISILPRSVQDLIDPRYQMEGNANANIYQANRNKTKYPWLEKLEPKSKVYGMSENFKPSDLGFDHIMDVLREDLATGRIRPEQMNKISITDAVRRTAQYDQELAKKMNESRAAARADLPIYKDYPEGYKWVELNKPGSFAAESEAMGHSVRGYEPPKGHPDWVEGSGDSGSSGYGHGGWEAIKSGKAKVYSLVDSKGKPHTTVEVGPTHRDRGFFGDQRPTGDEYYNLQKNYIEGINKNTIDPNLTFAEWWRSSQGIPEPEALPPRISQIKPPGNYWTSDASKGRIAKNPKYMEDIQPYLQDFVKSGQWSDVGDLGNTGLIKHNTGKYVSKAEMDALSRKHFGKSIGNKPDASESPEQYFKRMSRYDPEQLSDADKAFVEDWRAGNFPPPEGMANGGEVHMGGGGAAIKAALAKLGKFATEADLAAIKEAGRIAHEQEAFIRAAKNADVENRLQSMPPRSKAANLEMGMYHPVGGGLKLAKPFEALHSTRVPNPKVNKPNVKILTPEYLYRERAGLFPLVGDKADTGTFLTHIGENELEVPIGLGGGPRYMDANYNIVSPSESAAWESATGRTTFLGNQAQRIAESDRPAFGVYTAGSGTNTDFNIMGANAVLQQLGQSKLTKKAEKTFDKAMREEGTKAFPPIPDWPGIRSPQLEDMLLDKSNGNLRTKLFDTMGKENFQSMGFPDVPATRKAIMDPQLYDVPTHEAGFRIARMDPTGRIVEDPLHPSDYPTAMAGELEGQLDMGADYKDMFSTHFARRRLLSQPESGDYYSFLRAFPIQNADQEWLDKIMKAQEAKDKLIKTGKYAEGGEVHMPKEKKKARGGLSSIK